MQDEVRSQLRELAQNHLDYLVAAYSAPPRNDQELFELLDALDIQGVNRQAIVRQVTHGQRGSVDAQASPVNK